MKIKQTMCLFFSNSVQGFFFILSKKEKEKVIYSPGIVLTLHILLITFGPQRGIFEKCNALANLYNESEW